MKKIYHYRNIRITLALLLFLLFILEACATTTTPIKTVPDISGRYDLIEAKLVLDGDENALGKIIAGTIIIERLSPHIFGYYETIKRKGLRPNTYWNGYLYKEGKFFHYSYDFIKKKFESENDIDIELHGKTLLIKERYLNGKEVKRYRKTSKTKPQYISLRRSILRARKQYEEYFKAYFAGE